MIEFLIAASAIPVIIIGVILLVVLSPFVLADKLLKKLDIWSKNRKEGKM